MNGSRNDPDAKPGVTMISCEMRTRSSGVRRGTEEEFLLRKEKKSVVGRMMVRGDERS